MERLKRRSRPALEGLEGRTLLNGSKNHAVHAAATNTSPSTTSSTSATTQINYTTPQGSKVHVQLFGAGSLAGSTVAADGTLNLVYSGTGYFSQIIGTVKGGTGEAPLGTITNASVPINTLTGVGGTLIGRVTLPNFDLIPGGNINLTPGVNALTLNSVAANSQIHLRDNPLTSTLGFNTSINAGNSFGGANAAAGFGSNNNAGLGATTGTAAGSVTGTGLGAVSTGSSNITGIGTLDPQITGFGGSGVGAVNGKIPIIPTVGNGQNYLGTPGLTQAQVDQGRTRSFTVFNNGQVTLTAIGGTFAPGSNLIEPRDISKPGGPPPPPGVIVNIRHVRGGASSNSPPLGDANIYGYDPAANTLIRFDAVTGIPLRSIALPARPAGVTVGGVALARDGAELVVLVGVGSNVLAYDASTGTAVGQFSTANLASIGLTSINGIGTAGGSTVLVDTAASTDGTAQAINVASSLSTGQAVPVGPAFSPGRGFVLGGGITGVSGTGNLYALGSAFFDSFQPTTRLAGILTISPSSSGLSESSRTALASQGASIPANANGSIVNDPSTALGSFESFLALDTGVANGVNVIAKITPSTLALDGTFTLNDPNALADISESFHPELANTALVDVQGNVQSFTAHDVNNLVLNDAGNLNLLAANQASNSSVIGLPFGHVAIQNRSNVAILTNNRLVGERGDVIVNSGTTQVGPLFLPTA